MAAAHHISSAPPQIPGYQLTNEESAQFRHNVAQTLGRDNPKFPGAQPVSFARQHLTELQQREYFMCEKTDGIRCLLWLHYKDNPNSDGVLPMTFLIDRKNNYYDVSPAIRIPYHQAPNNSDAFLYDTILDGELVNDQYPDGSKKLIFYVFDCLAIDGIGPLDKRLGIMRVQLFQPWQKYLLQHKLSPPLEPFKVMEKTQHSSYHIGHMFDTILPTLRHGNDGLIFTCKSTRYQFGTDNHILKWKPPHENTIDFKLRIGEFPMFDPEDGEEGLIPDYDAKPNRFELLVNHGKNQYRPFAHDLYVTDQEWEMLKGLNQRLDGRIIECFRDTNGRWSVLGSIEDPVTEQDLRAAEGTIATAVRQLRAEEAARSQPPPPPHDMEHAAKKRRLNEMNGSEH
ncbi:Dcp1p-Dcp2p decapping enzyme complex alpha subunit [Kalmusia sp. IMI 367209]|nr:Dcp1p-Dcp2p decapping enzyme complex alpha subunit [Kalmusia sp. IMI 367209]